MAAEDDTPQKRAELEYLENSLGACRDILTVCRDHWSGRPADETEQQRSDAVYDEVFAIVSRAIGNRQSFGDEDFPLIYEGTLRRCLELLGAPAATEPVM